MDAHEIFLNARARKLAPTRLTGNFGSEILRSMSTFKPVGLSSEFVESGFRPMLDVAVQRASKDMHPVTFAAFKEIPWRLFGTLAAGRSQVTFRTPYLDNELVALAYQAPPTSRKSAHAALRLVGKYSQPLSDIPTDRGLLAGENYPSQLARRIFSEITFKLDYLYSEGMPDWLTPLDLFSDSLSRAGVLGLHKFLLYRRWFGGELGGYVGDILQSEGMQRIPHIDTKFLATVCEDHRLNRKNYTREIHTALTLEAIDRLLLRP
jgi:asparagine synthase (glutamine-hydrolysing)